MVVAPVAFVVLEQNALPDILMTMSEIPDMNRELAEVAAVFTVSDVLRRKPWALGAGGVCVLAR